MGEAIKGSLKLVESKSNNASPSPCLDVHNLYAGLNEKIIGQTQAKKVVAASLIFHCQNKFKTDASYKKSNILLIGPSGSGKTEVVKSAAEILKMNILVVDASRLTPSGFAGEDCSQMLEDLFEQTGRSLHDTEHGVIFLDEIDKLATNSGADTKAQSRRVMGELLKLIEGAEYNLKIKGKIPGLEERVKINTRNILFIAAGAFHDLVEQGDPASRVIGIVNDSIQSPTIANDKSAMNRALVEYGFLPELLGRFNHVAKMKPVSKDDFQLWLRGLKGVIQSNFYLKVLKDENVNIVLTNCLLDYLADEALRLGLGYRGIQKLLDERLIGLIFEIEAIRGRTVGLSRNEFAVIEDSKVIENYVSVVQMLYKFEAFVELDQKKMENLITRGAVVKYDVNDELMTEGDESTTVMFLLTGSIRVTNRAGLNVLIGEEGSVFGEIGFLEKGKRTATLKAQTPSQLLVYSCQELSQLIKAEPDIGVKILRAFAQIAFDRVRQQKKLSIKPKKAA